MLELFPIIDVFINNNPESVTWGVAGMILLVGIVFQRSEIKEFISEWKLNHLLKNVGKDVLHNVTIPDGMDGTIFIEYLILAPKNIFLLGVKKYRGLIFAAEKIDLWTQVIGNKSYKFNNPLLLLESDVLALSSKIESTSITEKVLFINGSEFPKGKPDRVVSIDEVKKWKDDFDGNITSAVSTDWERLKSLALDNNYKKGVLIDKEHSQSINVFFLVAFVTMIFLWLLLRLVY